MKQERKTVLFFTVILAVLAGLVLWKFIIPLISAVILSFIFYPVYAWIAAKTKRPKLSSLLMLIVIMIGILIPVTFLTKALIDEATTLFNTDISVDNLQTSVNKLGLNIDISSIAADTIITIAQAIKNWVPHVLLTISDVAVVMFVMFFVMFYLFVEGKNIIVWIQKYIPLRTPLKKELFTQLGQVTYALIIGQVITAIVQGFIGALGFLIFGIEGVVFWGFVMTIFAFIPIIGPFLIWVPAGIILILQQKYFAGIGLLVYGVLIISTVDNLLRPKLVSQHANIHPVTVLLGVLGGLQVFGIMGIVIGPVVLSLFSLFGRVYLKSIQSHKHF